MHDFERALGKTTTTELVASPSMVLVDARDTCLRATWHHADGVVVLSHWRDGVCASTFQLAGGREILGELGHLGRTHPGLGRTENSVSAGDVPGPGLDLLSDLHVTGRLDDVAVDGHPAITNGGGGQRAGPVKPNRPKPLIEPHAGDADASGFICASD